MRGRRIRSRCCGWTADGETIQTAIVGCNAVLALHRCCAMQKVVQCQHGIAPYACCVGRKPDLHENRARFCY